MLWRDNPACRRTAGAFRRLVGNEHGFTTVEFVLWVPIFALLMIAAIDATVLYLHHSEMWNVSRDVARRVAVGDISEAEAGEIVADELFLYDSSTAYYLETSDPADTDVRIAILTQVADADYFGVFRPVLTKWLEAAVVMRREPI